MDFEDDIRRQVLTELPHDPSLTAGMASKSVRELLIIYRNWQSRLIQPKPRQVHRSQELLRNPLTADPAFKPGLELIIAKLEQGTDINPHLSRDIQMGYQPKPAAKTGRRSRRRDLDLLLNDWGIHHLHLSTQPDADRFMKRTGPLLFAVFRPGDVYLIDIVAGHGGWTSVHLIGIMAREWPHADLVSELPQASGLSESYSDADRAVLRAKHVNAAIEIDGRFYLPPKGLVLSGISTEAVVAADRLLNHLGKFRTFLAGNPEYLPKTMEEKGVSPPSSLHLHFAFFEDGGYGIIETQTNMRFRLAS